MTQNEPGSPGGERVPRELLARPQWVVWKRERREGRVTKVPYDARTGARASSTDPYTWCSYAEALAARGVDGVGFVVTEGDPFVGIDLDGALGEDGSVRPWARAILEALNSYTERTPSGRGLRVWVRGRLPGRGRKKSFADPETGEPCALELYDRDRYFTVTGLSLDGRPSTIRPRGRELSALVAQWFDPSPQPPPRNGEGESSSPLRFGEGLGEGSDDALLARAFAAKNGERFARLWRGSSDDYAGDESAADLALCGMLYFWTGGDRAACDRLFRRSGLFRSKWDARRGDRTYGERTLDRVFADGGEVYRGAEAAPLISDNSVLSVSPRAKEWPARLEEEAFHGLAGEFVRRIQEETEADPAALLITFLVGMGNLIGPTVFTAVGPAHHRLREFVALVGPSATGRKGTSVAWLRAIAAEVDPSWASEIAHGLSTGEGLIWLVRDPIQKTVPIKEKGKITGYQQEVVDPGVEDKRRLVIEEELANVLKVMMREGNTLSGQVRQAWDRDDIQSITKNNPARATGAHISLIAQITPEELRRYLTETEAANGFANRFLFVCVCRARLLPHGGRPVDLVPLAAQIASRVERAREVGEICRDAAAARVWEGIYGELTAERPGLLGAVTSRAEAHVLRLSALYAALDASAWIRVEHLLAALAVWEYCLDSARCLFGDALGDPYADPIRAALRAAPEGLDRTTISGELFRRSVPASRLDTALTRLLDAGLAVRTRQETGGRPREVWFAAGAGEKRGRSLLDRARAIALGGAEKTELSEIRGSDPPAEAARLVREPIPPTPEGEAHARRAELFESAEERALIADVLGCWMQGVERGARDGLSDAAWQEERDGADALLADLEAALAHHGERLEDHGWRLTRLGRWRRLTEPDD